MIVSGHSRCYWAKRLELQTVPCIVRTFDNDLEIEHAVIHGNRQRLKTREQTGLEYMELKRIESERAKERQIRAGQERGREKEGSVNSRQPIKKGKAAAIAAEAVGISEQTGERSVKVLREIEKAQKSGNSKRVEELREALNKKSVKAAYEIAVGTQPKAKPTTGATIGRCGPTLPRPFPPLSRWPMKITLTRTTPRVR